MSQNGISIGFLIVSVVVVLSYLADLFAHRIKVPSVLVLMCMGMLIRPMLEWSGAPIPNFEGFLPFLGTVGLILIVLEAALHLVISRNSLLLMRRAFGAAFIILILTALGVMGFLHLYTGAAWQACLVNAIPFAVVSSAMAIPTSSALDGHKREFVVYESTFSDILGILLFTVVANGSGGAGDWVVNLSGSALVTLVLSVILAIGLVWLVTQLRHHVKFFLVLFLLLLAYSLAKLFHLPALLMVFLFGLALNNADFLLIWKPLRRFIDLRKVQVELRYTRVATGESAFLVRTFFFVVFGYVMDWSRILHGSVWQLALGILVLLFGVRWLYLRRFAVVHLFPETFIAPRGLITVLLFYSVPPEMAIGGVGAGVVFLVVVLSAVVMALGVWRSSERHGTQIPLS